MRIYRKNARHIDYVHSYFFNVHSWAAANGVQIRTVIDIGGQNSKVIALDDDNEIANSEKMNGDNPLKKNNYS